MTRKEARDAAFKIMFEFIFLKDDAKELLEKYYELFGDAGEQKEYLESVVTGAIEKKEEIDAKISQFLKNRTISRISKVSLSALRVGVYELLFTDTPESIIINEAVELAKTYEEEKTGKFVNGVLSSVNKEARQ